MKPRRYRKQFASMMLTAAITLALPASVFAESTVPEDAVTGISSEEMMPAAIPEHTAESTPASVDTEDAGNANQTDQIVQSDQEEVSEIISETDTNSETSDLISLDASNSGETPKQEEGILIEDQLAGEGPSSSSNPVDQSDGEELSVSITSSPYSDDGNNIEEYYGTEVTLTANVDCPDNEYTLTYQWYDAINEEIIAGANSQTYRYKAHYVYDSDRKVWRGDSYYCIVTASKVSDPTVTKTAKSDPIYTQIIETDTTTVDVDCNPPCSKIDGQDVVSAGTTLTLTAKRVYDSLKEIDYDNQDGYRITYHWSSVFGESIQNSDSQSIQVTPDLSVKHNTLYYECQAAVWKDDEVIAVGSSPVLIIVDDPCNTIDTARFMRIEKEPDTRSDSGFIEIPIGAYKQAYVSFTPNFSGKYRVGIQLNNGPSANLQVEVLDSSNVQVGAFTFDETTSDSMFDLTAGKTYYLHTSNPCNESIIIQFNVGCPCAHDWGDWTTVTPSTYTSQGQQKRICKICEETETRAIPVIPHSHSFGNWVILSNATALSEGKQSRTCSICGVVESQPLPKLVPFLNLNVSGTLPMKTRQKSKVVKVTGLQSGDYVVSWTSSKNSVVKISGKGNAVTLKAGKKKGTAKITVVTAANASRTFTVKVQTGTVKTKKLKVSIARKLKLKKGKKVSIGALVSPLTTQQKLTYSTSNKKVATVSKGVIRAKKKGKATITVRSGSKKVTIKVTVK